jgi:hypothetical protein
MSIKVISNTLEVEWERWDDPGDYPNAVASGPLPSYDYAIVEGELVIEADDPEEFEDIDADELADLSGVKVTSWGKKIEGTRCTLWVEECEGERPEPDYDDRDD